jgi:hypothetical protein
MKNPHFIPQYSSQKGFLPDFDSDELYFSQSNLETCFFTLFAFLKGSEVKEVLDHPDHPYKVCYTNKNGQEVTHSPDALIFKSSTSKGPQNTIGEIKYQKEIAPTSTNFKKIREHALEGLKHARRLGPEWSYNIFTEREIQIPLLSSVKFLANFAHRFYHDPEVAKDITASVEDAPGVTVKQLAKALGIKSLPTLFNLLYWHELEFDYTTDLRPESHRNKASIFPSLMKPVAYFDLVNPVDVSRWL